jgi:hypothetical protein
VTRTLRDLERRIVANAGLRSGRPLPRWSHVADATGFGSTRAQQMCRDAGFDPDEVVGAERDEEEDEASE